MGIQGTGLKDSNIRLRFFVLVLMGIMAFGSVIYWRNKTLTNAEYVDIPTHTRVSRAKSELRSANFQLDIQDSSPTVK